MSTKDELLKEQVHQGSVQTMETKVNKQEQPATSESTPPATQRKVRVGLTAAVLEDGEFVFNIHGTNPGLVELLGLVEFAKKVVDAQLKDQLNIDEAAVVEQLGKLKEEVTGLSERVRTLSAS